LKPKGYQRQTFASADKVYQPKTIQSKIISSKIEVNVVNPKLATSKSEVGPSHIHTKTYEVVNIDETKVSVVSSPNIGISEVKASFIDSHISTSHIKS
jgi:hypothetical protein